MPQAPMSNIWWAFLRPGALRDQAARHFFRQLSVGKCIVIPAISDYIDYDEPVYDILEADHVRCSSYLRALDRSVVGKTVVDIGSGSRAFFAVHSVRAGAKRAFAVESNRQAAARALRLVAALGLNDKITVVEGDARYVELPEKADICVAELFGHIASSEGARAILREALARTLKPGGLSVPGHVFTMCAPICDPPCERDKVAERALVSYAGIKAEGAGKWRNLRQVVYNCPQECLLAPPAEFEYINCSQPNIDTTSQAKMTFTVGRTALWTGFGLWIRVVCDSDIQFSTFSGTHWGMVWFKVVDKPVIVCRGDLIRCVASLQTGKNGINPDYFLRGCVSRSGTILVRFEFESPY